jgi:hypothetical protein
MVLVQQEVAVDRWGGFVWVRVGVRVRVGHLNPPSLSFGRVKVPNRAPKSSLHYTYSHPTHQAIPMTDKQATTATAKLIPDSLASALQSVVSVAAISTIDTGDRSLNAALGTLITVGFTLTLERLQKFTSWTHLGTTALSSLQLNSLVPVFHCFTRNKSLTQGKEKGETDFDFDSVPQPTCLFKHEYVFQSQSVYFTLREWVIQTYGCNTIFKRPSPMKVSLIDASVVVKQLNIEEYAAFPKGKYIPIWYSKRQFIYLLVGESITCSLFCNSDTVLNEFIKMIEQKHIERIETIKTASAFLCYVERSPSKPLRRELLNPQKTFECMFFEQKTELLEMLTRFKNSDMYAKHLGIDNTLGILLYGPPGTGKTMCCNAIANFLRKDIVQATVKEMRRKETMDSLFDFRTKIVLFDEFDCLLDVIKSRETMGSKHSNEDDGSSIKLKLAMKFLDMAHSEKDEEKKKALMTQYESTLNQDDGKVDLQYLLTKFQGLESADGRCIIACTNHPDKIDSALKRKGRFDIIIKLGNATPRMTFDMVAYYFQITDDEKDELEKQFTELPNRLISPAELQDICANSNGPNETLEKVMARASFLSDNASVISEDSQTISVGTSNPHD